MSDPPSYSFNRPSNTSGGNLFSSTSSPKLASTFGQPAAGSPEKTGFNVFGNPNQQPTSGFGNISSKSGIFGGQTSPSTSTGAKNVFGGQPLFGKTNQSAMFGKATISSSFGSTSSSLTQSKSNNFMGADNTITSGNISFGKSTTTALFGKPRDTTGFSLFGKPLDTNETSEKADPKIQFGNAAVFGSTPVSSSSHSLEYVSASNHPTLSKSNVFGTKPLFSGGSSSLSPEKDGNFRKRSSSGTMSAKSLFGKKQTALPSVSEEGNSTSGSMGAGLGSSDGTHRNIFKKSSFDEYGNLSSINVSMFPTDGVSFPSKTYSDVSESAVSPSSSGSTRRGLFGKEIQATEAYSTLDNNVADTPFTSSLQPKFGKTDAPQSQLFGKNDRPKSDAPQSQLFGKNDQPQSDAPKLFGKAASTGAQLFGKSTDGSQSQLFGKTDKADRPLLFGKTQSSHGNASDDKSNAAAASPTKRSLSKWSRGRDSSNIDKKRAGDVVGAGDAKRVRAEGDQGTKISPSTLFSRSRLGSVRQHSTEDLSVRTSIIVKDIPIHLNKGQILRDHFSKFGQIKRLQPMPTKNSANVSFVTHAEAKAAKDKGKQLGPGSPLTIFWRNTAAKSPGSSAMKLSPGLSDHPTGADGMLKQQSFPSTETRHVQDELASMAGTFDVEPVDNSSQHKSRSPLRSMSPSKTHQPETRRTSDKRSPTPPRKTRQEEETVTAPKLPDIDIAKNLLKIMWKAKPKDATEIVAVLDARDKFLKLLRGRQSDLASAKAFTGCCREMCTEKERYYREDIRRLALYEVIPSTMTSVTGLKSKVDHARAVKEYSRSSADQEEPLPHELRPLDVLVTTMNYLLTEIADKGGDGKWSEWYDFLWNRTRGIRKDITQQQLCEVDVAELLEKCSRFHIFCSARLCEEDSMTFDAKINNENLTKCLQTLKELYADLEKKQTFCPNEAEFRAYMVLMNLNQGDTLREVQQLKPEIRESSYIHFALKAYNALNSNNYVRFFRLIREATFLNSCILLRYFNQIRGQALRIIMKAHRAYGRNRVMYPVQELIRLLSFEDQLQVEQFCDHYCLTVEGEEIVMDGQAFLEPEGSIPESRAQTLVEAKRTVSVGEVINGCPLPPLVLPELTSSFDENGVFILPKEMNDSITKGLITARPNQPLGAASSSTQQIGNQPAAESDGREMHQEEESDQSTQNSIHPFTAHGLPNALSLQRERIVYSNDAIKSIVRTIILDEIDADSAVVAKEVVAEERRTHQFLMLEVDDIGKETVQSLARSIAEEQIEDEELNVRKKLAEEMAAQKQRTMASVSDELVEVIVAENVAELADDEMRLVTAELQRQRMDRCSVEVQSEFLASTVDNILVDVAQEVFEVDVLAKRERLAATEACVMDMKCRRFFQMWRGKYLSKIRVKRAMLDFPCVSLNRPAEERVDTLIPERPSTRLNNKAFYINKRARLTVQTPMEVIQQQLFLSTRLSMVSAQRMLAGLRQLRPLDLKQLVIPLLQRSYCDWLDDESIEPETCPLQWKLSVSFPPKDALSSEQEACFVKWIRAKLCKDSNRDAILEAEPKPEGEILSCYNIKDDGKECGSLPPVGICIKAFHGVWNDNQELAALNKDYLKGTCALLFVLPSADSLILEEANSKISKWKKIHQRLHQMLKQKAISPSLPLVLIVPFLQKGNTLEISELEQGLELSKLHKAGYVSTLHVAQIYVGAQDHPVEFFSDWTSKLSSSLRFAANNVPTPPKLQVKPVSSFVEDLVVEFYKAPVYQDLRTRTRLQLLHQSPHSLISLYNAVIEHALEVCSSNTLRTSSWPAPELDQSNQNKQVKTITSEWNSESHLCNLFELVAKLRLPYFRYSDLEADNWATACKDVWAYIAIVTKKDSGSAKINLYQQIAELLARTRKRFDRLCWLASEDGPCEPGYTFMAWTDLLDVCIHYRLMSLRSGHLHIRRPEDDDDDAQPEKVEDFVEPLVYYDEDEVNDWEPPSSWSGALRDTETAECGQLKGSVTLAAIKRDETLLETSTVVTQNDPVRNSATNDLNNQSRTQHTEETNLFDESWASLKQRLEREREAADKFQAHLAAAAGCNLPAFDKPALPSPHGFMTDFSPIVSTIGSERQKSSPTTRLPMNKTTTVASAFHIDNTPKRQTSSLFGKDNASLRAVVGKSQLGATGNEKLPESGGSHSPTVFAKNNMPCSGHIQGKDNEEEFYLPWTERSLSERVECVQDRLEKEKQADLLFEIKLQRLMDSSPLV